MIERLFGSRTRAKILGWFFTHTEERFFVRQLAAILKEDPTNLSREMSNLEKLGVLTSEKDGNLKRFQVNRESPFYMEMKGLILKTAGVGGVIKESLTPISGVDMALIYGSYARGQENGASDVDLLIVGSVDLNKLDRALAGAEKTLGREINYVSYTQKEFRARKRRKEGFLSEVLSHNVLMLVGTEDEFKSA